MRQCREILYELHKTLEPLLGLLDTVIVRVLLVYLLLEKAWTLVH